jgi:hypothetical protein
MELLSSCMIRRSNTTSHHAELCEIHRKQKETERDKVETINFILAVADAIFIIFWTVAFAA